MVRYNIDSDRSELSAEARSSLHPIHSQTRQLSGWVEAVLVDGAVDTAQPANARIELSTESIQADNALVNREIQKRLDARRYPTVVVEIHQVVGPSEGRYEVHGELALRHVTKPVTGHATLVAGDDSTLEITGELTIDVRDFDLDPPKLLGMRVYPDVAVSVRIVATMSQ